MKLILKLSKLVTSIYQPIYRLGNANLYPRGDQSCEVEYAITPQPEDDVYRIDLYLAHADLYNALQFSFQWDESGFEIVDWSPGELLSEDDIRMPQNAGQGASILAYTTEKWSVERLYPGHLVGQTKTRR